MWDSFRGVLCCPVGARPVGRGVNRQTAVVYQMDGDPEQSEEAPSQAPKRSLGGSRTLGHRGFLRNKRMLEADTSAEFLGVAGGVGAFLMDDLRVSHLCGRIFPRLV